MAASPNYINLLESAGYRIRGRRADCPHCDGHSRLTVSVGDECFHCHRCGKSGNVRTLARELGKSLPPESAAAKATRERQKQFGSWLDRKHRVIAGEYRRLGRNAALAKIALQYFPDWDLAWDHLANFYHQEGALSAALDTLIFTRSSLRLEVPADREDMFKEYEATCCQ